MAESKKPQFRVRELSLIGNELKQAGELVTLPEGTLPAENLEAIDDEGKALEAEYAASNAERVKKLAAQYADAGAGITNPEQFAAALSAAIKQMIAEGVLSPSVKAPAKEKA